MTSSQKKTLVVSDLLSGATKVTIPATSSGTKRGRIFFDIFSYEIPAGITSIKIRLTFIPM